MRRGEKHNRLLSHDYIGVLGILPTSEVLTRVFILADPISILDNVVASPVEVCYNADSLPTIPNNPVLFPCVLSLLNNEEMCEQKCDNQGEDSLNSLLG